MIDFIPMTHSDDISAMKQCVGLENISFSFEEGRPVLENINLSIREGEYVGLVGGNGSGKTTLLRIILGLIVPTEGNVSLFGQAAGLFREREWIGYVPQHASRTEGNFPMSVMEVVASGFSLRGHSVWKPFLSAEERILVRDAIRVAEIGHLEGRLVGELSGGERQRVFIARALVSHPRLLVLDEPTTGVDAQSQASFYRFLGELNSKVGLTILLVSHDLEVLAREVKTVACLNRTLVCHLPSADFDPDRYLSQVYGDRMHAVRHQH